MKTNAIYLAIRIDYSYDENKANKLEAASIAKSLTIRPNHVSIVEGVKLDNVNVLESEVLY